MKIISKFKDYYDGAQGAEYDNRLVYVRQQEIFPKNSYGDKDDLRDILYTSQMDGVDISAYISDSKKYSALQVSSGIIYLCGKPYPYLLAKWYDPSVPKSAYGTFEPTAIRWRFFYDESEAKAFCKDVNESRAKPERGVRNPFDFLWRRKSSFTEESITAMFQFNRSRNCADWAVSKALPAFTWGYSCGREQTGSVRAPMIEDGAQVVLNPKLADFEFYKVMPAPQAYQEIEMFLGNIAAPDKCPVELSEKDRIQQHGFDKMSFRKAPTKPGKKRGKKNGDTK